MSDPHRGELPSPRHITYVHAVLGNDIYNFFGNRVVEYTTARGDALAIKVKPPDALDRSEGDMMHYASENGILAPRVRGVYDIVTTKPIARVLVSARVSGVPLSEVWTTLSEPERITIKAELRSQLACIRACKQPFIGRIGRQHTRNVYDRIPQTYCGPFSDEREFDRWCIARLKGGPLVRWRWQLFLDRERHRNPGPGEFVLTHGDLSPRNILVHNGHLSGILDWEKSGFFPGYAEYAFAMVLCHGHEKWWIPVLEDILPRCSQQRLDFTRLVEDNGF
ncbi:hypothetical protein VTK73DRAFT_8288 [Phialemonium thermophilum]|uniref:Aminoglycoside phosphotransferase domain-containing protein n=1 Tax=Phialemonium thermophilum TaxID=223376 RepID=A0ABR3W9C5_9PEZI